MSVSVIISSIQSSVVIRCLSINNDQRHGMPSIITTDASVRISCVSSEHPARQDHDIPISEHSNASDIVQSAIDKAVYSFGCDPRDVIVMNSNFDVIEVERITVDMPNGSKKKAISVKEDALPLREARALMVGTDAIATIVKGK